LDTTDKGELISQVGTVIGCLMLIISKQSGQYLCPLALSQTIVSISLQVFLFFFCLKAWRVGWKEVVLARVVEDCVTQYSVMNSSS